MAMKSRKVSASVLYQGDMFKMAGRLYTVISVTPKQNDMVYIKFFANEDGADRTKLGLIPIHTLIVESNAIFKTYYGA
jgi:hypothetical protein